MQSHGGGMAVFLAVLEMFAGLWTYALDYLTLTLFGHRCLVLLPPFWGAKRAWTSRHELPELLLFQDTPCG